MKIVGKLKPYKALLTDQRAMRFAVTAVTLFLLSVHPSAAQDFAGVTTFLDAIVGAITGEIGIAVAALAVIAIGFSFMTGRMDWTFAVAVIIGIAIVFGGASFVQGLAAN